MVFVLGAILCVTLVVAVVALNVNVNVSVNINDVPVYNWNNENENQKKKNFKRNEVAMLETRNANGVNRMLNTTATYNNTSNGEDNMPLETMIHKTLGCIIFEFLKNAYRKIVGHDE